MKTIDFDKNIEGLRGFAAIAVVWAHVFGFKYLLTPNYHPTGYWSFINVAHPSVLIFFLLSGYVIGYTNKNEFSISIVSKYLKKRAIRLLPIYILAIVFTLIVVPEFNISKIIGNLFFLQTLLVDVLKGNTILWTLNNEVIYYFLFIAVLYFKPNLKVLILLCIILSTCFSFSIFNLQIVNKYLVGWIFWLVGLYCAWNLPKLKTQKYNYLILPILLLMIATNLYSPGAMLSGFLELEKKGIFIEGDIFLLPITFSLFAIISNKKAPFFIILLWISFIIPISIAIILFFKGRLLENDSWKMALICSIFSFVFTFVRFNQEFFSKLSFIGSISYAIYVFHMPLLYFFNKLDVFSSTKVSFWLRFFVFVTILFMLCYLAELVLQPFIKRKFQNA